MRKLIDITGKTFGYLVAREQIIGVQSQWRCVCDCGEEKTVRSGDLRSGKTVSCGCKRGTHRHSSVDGRRSPTYSCWSNMISRCTQPSSPAFAHYRRLGVTIADRWRDYSNFLADMGERPSLEYSLDRWPNNDGNYEPGNVRWATKREQANNRATNIRFEYRGKSYTLAELSRETGVSKETLRGRLCRSKLWTVEGAIHTPMTGKKGRAC